ncbi:hypothetical protein ACOSQ3_003456 [Xanthoceras sorbifolium]
MQIFHWLFKVTHEQATARENYTSNSPANNSKCNTYGKNAKSRDIILYKNCDGAHRRSKRVKASELLGCKHLKPFACSCRKHVKEACFYSTLNLRRIVGKVNKRQHWIYSMKMKKEDHIIARGLGSTHKANSAAASHAGNKVIPISDSTLSSSNITNDQQCGAYNTNNKNVKGDHKTKTISRMKELLRWAAAAKSDKGGKFIGRKVLQFRNRATLKAVPDDDQLSMDSPKISFRWDVESCSTTSSAYSGISMASSSMINDQITSCKMMSLSSTPIHDINRCSTRKGNWITTDAEFVVLEL